MIEGLDLFYFVWLNRGFPSIVSYIHIVGIMEKTGPYPVSRVTRLYSFS